MDLTGSGGIMLKILRAPFADHRALLGLTFSLLLLIRDATRAAYEPGPGTLAGRPWREHGEDWYTPFSIRGAPMEFAVASFLPVLWFLTSALLSPFLGSRPGEEMVARLTLWEMAGLAGGERLPEVRFRRGTLGEWYVREMYWTQQMYMGLSYLIYKVGLRPADGARAE